LFIFLQASSREEKAPTPNPARIAAPKQAVSSFCTVIIGFSVMSAFIWFQRGDLEPPPME